MNPSLIESFRSIIREAAVELFDNYGVNLDDSPPEENKPDFVAAVSFTSSELGGALSLVTRRTFARSLVAATPGAIGTIDWMGELANQLFGGIQRRLYRYGISIRGGLPVVVEGGDLRVSTGRRIARTGADREHFTVEASFGASYGPLTVRVALDIPVGFQLNATTGTTEPPEQGEPILF